jgi:superfamily I DNA and/or RNA helicase
MKLIDFKTNEEFTFSNLRCKLLISKKILGDSGRIQLMEDNHYKLIMGDATYEFKVLDEQDSRMLSDKMKQYTYNLVYISNVGKDNDEFFMHVTFFYNANREAKLNIVLSQKVKDTLKKKHLITKKQGFEEGVKENFILSDGTNVCYAYTRGKYKFTHTDEENLDDNSTNQEGQVVTASAEPVEEDDAFQSIRIYGKDYSIHIKIKGKDDDMFLCAESVDTRNRFAPPMALRIGDLSFKDGETFVSEKIKKELEITSGYLGIWDKYTSIEGDFLLQKARAIGQIRINRNKINKGEGGLIVYPEGLSEDQKKLISAGDYLLISENVPVYIAGENMSWNEYKKTLNLLKEMKIRTESNKSRKILSINRSGYWVVESGETDILPDGIITYSVFGDMQQIMRRETARELIENGESAFPSLGLVIEGRKSETTIETNKEKKIEPITPFVKEKIFSHEPRPRQRDAIEIALNTPDIAIIQGPPGTGKTTVITAIIERLNEIADKRKDNRGQVLITSFQHDAVRNVIGRLSINSLPTIKFGKQGDDDLSQEKAIEDWCFDYALKLKERNPAIQQTAEQKEFERKHDMYLSSPNNANALVFLNFAKRINVDNEIDAEIDQVINETNLNENASSSKLLEKVRRLRTTQEGFLDDGPETADDLLAELEDIMRAGIANNDDILDVLQEAADFSGNDIDDEMLDSFSKVKQELLERCTPRPSYRIEKPRAEILSIYTKILKTLQRPQNAEDEILFNLLNELENNVSEVEETVASYNFVYAATAQQSEGKDIKRAKNINKWEHPVYDTVIIDEAARVNPGDLMVPMAQAKRRIILVGDHRQLPHIYDEEIFESMRDSGNDVGKDVVKISLFQYLKEKAEELYKLDGVSRTITLDAQYRMHPELGNFVNRNFYEPYGEGFESPLSAENFAQELTPKPYLWINMPNSSGNEEKDGTSRIRWCEAKYIVNQIRDYILSEEGEKLSYGVITFYSAQAKLIKKLLKDKDISERVRVGSVDAFQGMEFDVIFLSVVRSHAGIPDYNEELLSMDVSSFDETNETYKQWQSYKADVGLKNYGFLTSENRLCVALSRQKRLLIVVGDSDIFHTGKWANLAEKCVPAMKNFYELCDKEGAVLNA